MDKQQFVIARNVLIFEYQLSDFKLIFRCFFVPVGAAGCFIRDIFDPPATRTSKHFILNSMTLRTIILLQDIPASSGWTLWC